MGHRWLHTESRGKLSIWGSQALRGCLGLPSCALGRQQAKASRKAGKGAASGHSDEGISLLSEAGTVLVQSRPAGHTHLAGVPTRPLSGWWIDG